MKRTLNIILAVSLPFLFGGGLFALLVQAGKAGIFNCILSHDVLESHVLSGLFPLFTVISFFCGLLPASVLMLRLFTPAAITEGQQEAEEAAQPELQRLSEAPRALLIQVGQVFTSPGTNCHMRVKALKVSAILHYHNELLADYL